MLSKADFTQLQKIFVTKTEFTQLKVEVNQLRNEVTQLKIEVAQLRSEVNQLKIEVAQLRSEVQEMKAMVHEIIFEIKNMREEFFAVTYRNREHADRLELHESRISLLEEKISF